MTLNAKLITFVPATLIKSADMNSNFAALNATTAFNGGVPTMNFESGNVQSDGFGNLKLAAGQLGTAAINDMMDRNANDLYLKSISSTGQTSFVCDGQLVMTTQQAPPNNVTLYQGGLVFATGSISRAGWFTGVGNGTYSHGNGGVPPNICQPVATGTTPDADGYNSVTPTTVRITTQASVSFNCIILTF